MGKYIKWELRNFFKKEWKIGVFVLVITFLMLLLMKTDNLDTNIGNLVAVPFSFMMIYLFFAMFIQGTRVIVNTYKNKTYLLESMISYSPSKILLSKYLIAIILNVMYGVVLLIISCLLVACSGLSLAEIFSSLKEIIGEIGYLELFKGALSLIIYSISFTSLVVMVYIITKCINPGKMGTIVLSVLIWWIIIYVQTIVLDTIVGGISVDNTIYILTLIINLAFILIYYFITVKLIRDKLEIYT